MGPEYAPALRLPVTRLPKGAQSCPNASFTIAPLIKHGEDGGAVPRIRYLAQDRLQNLLALSGLRCRWTDGSFKAPVSARQPPTRTDREANHRGAQGASDLGSSEDSR